MDLYYLVYTSVAAKSMNDNDLQELLEVSREANKQFLVTGMLICLPETFTQLIEGPKSHIEQLYLNIQKDKRHHHVTTLREGSITQRFFPDWAMACKKHSSLSPDEKVLDLYDQKVLQLFDIIEQ